MRKILLAILLAAALFVPTVSAQKAPTVDFRETLSKSTLGLYVGKQVCDYKKDAYGIPEWGCEFKYQFVCTASVIASNGEGAYAGLTAGHCFNWDLMAAGIDYFVSTSVTEKPVLNKVSVIKFENDERYDYGIFTFQSVRDFTPLVVSEDVQTPALGTKLINCNFSFGVVKEVVEGPVVSKQIGETEGPVQDLRRRYLVQIPFGPGASGSPVVDENTHQIVGLVEMTFPGTQMAAVVIPTGDNFKNFMDDDSAGLKPQADPKNPPKSQEDDSLLTRLK